MRIPRIIAGLLLLGSITGCSGADPGPTEPSSDATGEIPGTTQRVYLATALACSLLDAETARFTPLRVDGPSYTVSIDPAEDCVEQEIFSSYVYDVPMPAAGTVTITPGNQPPAELDAATVADDDGTSVFYGRVGAGQYEVTVIEPGKTDAVGTAGS